METPPPDAGDNTVHLIAVREHLLNRIEELKARIAVVDEQLLRVHTPGDKLRDGAGNVAFVVRDRQYRWSEKKAVSVLTVEQRGLCAVVETHLDRAKAKELLDESLYRMCCTVTEPTIAKPGGRA